MEFDIIELDTILNAVRRDEANQRGEIHRHDFAGANPRDIAIVQKRLERLIAIRQRLTVERERIRIAALAAKQKDTFDVMDDWAGPFKTLEQAVEHMFDLAGPGKNAVWTRSDGIYINDGFDPNTGKLWESLPEGAKWVDPGEYINIKNVSEEEE